MRSSTVWRPLERGQYFFSNLVNLLIGLGNSSAEVASTIRFLDHIFLPLSRGFRWFADVFSIGCSYLNQMRDAWQALVSFGNGLSDFWLQVGSEDESNVNRF